MNLTGLCFLIVLTLSAKQIKICLSVATRMCSDVCPHSVSHTSGSGCMKKYCVLMRVEGVGFRGWRGVGVGVHGAVAAERPLLSRQVTSDRCSQHMWQIN